MTTFHKKIWAGIGVMALLSPLGLILPEKFKAGGAWGEWGTDEIEKMLGYVPAGLGRLSELWKAPLPDYGPRPEGASTAAHSGWYILSGVLGIALCVVAMMTLKKALLKK
jgi:hypothetical protein